MLFLSLVLKLNETLFKPVFLKLVDFSRVTTESQISDAKEGTSKVVFFYHLVNGVADKLKSIFVPYFGYFLDNAIAYLSKFPTENSDNLLLENELIGAILTALHKCFLYDTEHFINKEKFDKLLMPIVNQLENTTGSNEEYQQRTAFLIPTLVQLAVCVNTNTLWKPLNYQVLLKTRNEHPKVRFAALKIIQECYNRIGEELTVLIPETAPFLSELMEDSNPQVERLCKELVNTMEHYLGTGSITGLL